MGDDELEPQLIPLVRGVSLFSRCTDGECRMIARCADIRSVEAGEKVIANGEESSELFIVLRGAADAVLDGQVRRSFGPGDYFGELAALAPAPRTSDVVMTAPSQLAVLTRGNLHRLIESMPGVAAKMLEGLADGFRSQIALDDAVPSSA